jgi:predicted AAA+ superfamily ATPase
MLAGQLVHFMLFAQLLLLGKDIFPGRSFAYTTFISVLSINKKRLVKAPKVYIRDSGFLHRLVGISSIDQLQGKVLVGASWEGYVIEQISNITKPDITLYFYRSYAGSEIN